MIQISFHMEWPAGNASLEEYRHAAGEVAGELDHYDLPGLRWKLGAYTSKPRDVGRSERLCFDVDLSAETLELALDVVRETVSAVIRFFPEATRVVASFDIDARHDPEFGAVEWLRTSSAH